MPSGTHSYKITTLTTKNSEHGFEFELVLTSFLILGGDSVPQCNDYRFMSGTGSY